ncbi:MAG: thiamine pyrophosphate-dependent enzyme, partial [Pseudomonadota bacterium]
NFVLVIENNQYAVSTTIEESTRETELYKRGIGIGVESYRTDGNDPLAIFELTQEAAEKCRAGKGPVLIEAVTFRHMGHHVNDPGAYMPEDRIAYYKDRDPVDRARNNLAELGGVKEDEIAGIEAEIDAEFEASVEFATGSDEVTVEEFRDFVANY